MVAKTRANLQSDIETLLADNTTGEISAADVRTVLTNIIDSCITSLDTGQEVLAVRGTSVDLGSGTNIAWNQGTTFERNVSANVTFTESSRPPVGVEQTIILKLVLSNNPTVTWPSAWRWVGGAAPTLVTGLNIIVATTNNGSHVQAHHLNPSGAYA